MRPVAFGVDEFCTHDTYGVSVFGTPLITRCRVSGLDTAQPVGSVTYHRRLRVIWNWLATRKMTG